MLHPKIVKRRQFLVLKRTFIFWNPRIVEFYFTFIFDQGQCLKLQMKNLLIEKIINDMDRWYFTSFYNGPSHNSPFVTWKANYHELNSTIYMVKVGASQHELEKLAKAVVELLTICWTHFRIIEMQSRFSCETTHTFAYQLFHCLLLTIFL